MALSTSFYPKLSDLIDETNIPGILDFLLEPTEDLLENIYFNNLKVVKSKTGNNAYYSLQIALYKRAAINLIGTDGVSLILNPGIDDPETVSTIINIETSYRWEILKFVKNFKIENFNGSTDGYFELFLNLIKPSPPEFVHNIITIFAIDENPIQKFVDDFFSKHGFALNIDNSLLSDYAKVQDLVSQLIDGEWDIISVLFSDYINIGSIEEVFENIKSLFIKWLGNFSYDSIINILVPQAKLSINNINLKLEFPRTVLIPLDEEGNIIEDVNIKSGLIFAIGTFTFTSTNGIKLQNAYDISFTKSLIGNTGISLEFSQCKIDISQNTAIPEISAAGYSNDFIGVYVGEAIIGLPTFWIKNDGESTAEIKGKDLIIGTGGFSGSIYMYKPDESALVSTNLGSESGFIVELDAFDITFLQNAIINSSITGTISIPNFTDSENNPLVINIAAHIGTDGDFEITATEPESVVFNFLDVFTIKIKSLSIGNKDDRFYCEVSGSLSCVYVFEELGDVLPKEIEIKKLRIWDDGTIEFVSDNAGGSIVIPVSFGIKIGPAEFSISSLELGSYEQFYSGNLRKYYYFGFSGSLGLDPGGVEVRGDGLKFYFTNDDDGVELLPHRFLRIDGVAIDISIPDSNPQLLLNGFLYMQDGPVPETGDITSGNPSSEYTGGISFALPKLKIGGTAGMRYNPDIPSFIVDVGLELPMPIPIAPTPLGIYGFRGLIGQRYVASRPYIGLADDASWYEYYKKKVEPTNAEGINIGKFAPENGFSLGVGASIATTPDQGKAFSSKVFLLLSLPEVFLIQGQAGILRKRLLIDSTEDPPFSAMLAVSDESIEASFGINYNLPEDSGNIAKVNALIEVAFFFTNSTAWYVNIGRDLPEEKRVTARLLTLFDAYFYFMLSQTGIRTGSGWSFELDKKFGPVGVEAGLYFDLASKLSFKPVQIGGSVAMGGYFRLVVFGFKFGLSASATLSAEAPKPFMITGTIQIGLELPWPFDDINVDLEFTWVFNTDIDVSEIAAFSQESSTTAEAVKSVNILTGETFAVKYIDVWDISTEPDIEDLDANYVIPMDAYINFELAKPINAYDASLSGIGGIAQPPLYTDYISPQKAKSDRARHEFIIDAFEIYCWDPTEEEWKPFEMAVANSPLQNLPLVDEDALENIKDGYWQIYESGKYNKISLLSRDPLTYISATTGDVVPEEMGISTETIFCTPVPASDTCITFTTEDTWDGSGVFPANTVVNHGGLLFYLVNSEGAIVENTLCGCMTEGEALSIDGSDTLEILFPISAPKITLCIGTQTSDVTLEFYRKVTDEDLLATGLPSFSYELITTENLTSTELTSSFAYEDVENSVDKIVIKSGVCSLSGSFALTAQGSQLLTFLHTLASNGTPKHLVTNTQLYTANDATYNTIFQNSVLFPYIPSNDTITYSVLTSGYTSSSVLNAIITDSYGYSCPITLETESGSSINWANVTGFTNIKPDPEYDTGGLIYHFLITGLFGSSSSVALKGSSCYPVGTINQDACKTQICKICYQDYPTYLYNESIIDETTLDADIKSMVDGLNGTIQPIWRPETIYTVAFSTRDKVFINDNATTVEEYIHSYAYQFRTKGPIGHFHQYRGEYNSLKDLQRSDEFKLQSLKYYIDFSKSFPNADGNILNAKPLYFENPKLSLFYINGYVYQMFATWEAYKNNPEVDLSLQVVIKDPIKATADESEIKTLNIDNWKKNTKPVTPIDIELLDNMLSNGDPCAEIPSPLDALDVYSEIEFESLKPLKLYTAIWNSIFDGTTAEVLKYGFQTSRYPNFESHINSYILSSEEGSEALAIFKIEEVYSTDQIDKVVSVLNGTMDATDSILQQFQEVYDRICDGILKVGPLAPPVSTEFNILISESRVVALIIKSPEPFNDPKTPGEILEGAINITINGDDPSNYKIIYSKDKSKAFISNLTLDLPSGEVSIDFKYFLFNGLEYDEASLVNVTFVLD